MKRTLLVSMFLVAVIALAPQRVRADEVTIAGATSSNPPAGIVFLPGNFSGTTSAGFAAFSNLGSYTLTNTPGTYSGTVDLIIAFSVPTGINGGGTTTFMATLIGNVSPSLTGGINIIFTNPIQNFTFSNASGSGSFTFAVNSLSVGVGGTTPVSGSVTGATFTPVSAPEPSTVLLLSAGLLLTPFLRRRIAG